MLVSRLWSASLIVVAALLPASSRAQVTSSLHARTDVWAPSAGDHWRGTSAFGGSIALDRSRWSLTAEAAAVSNSDSWDRIGTVGTALLSPAFGPLQLSVSGISDARAVRPTLEDGVDADVERMAGPRLTNSWSASVAARASLGFGRWGFWTGLDARHGSASDSASEPVMPAVGAWRQVGRALLTFSFAPRRTRVAGTGAVREEIRTDSLWNDTLGIWEPWQHPVLVTDSGASRSIRWDEAEARVFWSRGRLAADATLGGRMSGDVGAAMWASITGLFVVTPRIVVVAGAGSRPRQATAGWERSSYATLGLRLLGPPEPAHRPPAEVRPEAADFRIEAERPGSYVIRVRVPHARTVEISGDFTGWKPLALTRADTDRWETTVGISPGTHYVNVRVNGDRWIAPPGLPAVDDEFNGAVGMLVVP